MAVSKPIFAPMKGIDVKESLDRLLSGVIRMMHTAETDGTYEEKVWRMSGYLKTDCMNQVWKDCMEQRNACQQEMNISPVTMSGFLSELEAEGFLIVPMEQYVGPIAQFMGTE